MVIKQIRISDHSVHEVCQINVYMHTF